MKRFVLYFVLILLSFLLQTSVYRPFDSGMSGVTPDILLVVTVGFSLMRGEKTGTLIGFFSGLLMDLIFGEFLGFYALILMFIGYITGLFVRLLPPGATFVYIAITTAADLVFGFLSYVLLFLLRARFDIGFYMLHVILPETVLTGVSAVLLMPLLSALNDALDADEQRRAKKFV